MVDQTPEEHLKVLIDCLEAVKSLKAQILDTNDALEKLLTDSHIKSVMTIFREGEAKKYL